MGSLALLISVDVSAEPLVRSLCHARGQDVPNPDSLQRSRRVVWLGERKKNDTLTPTNTEADQDPFVEENSLPVAH